MKSFLCVTFFACFYWAAYLTNAADDRKCREHEVFEKCVRSNVTCERPYGGRNSEECVPGCVCEEKYVYDPKGNCIPGLRCKEFCNRNETFTGECVSICPRTCRGVKIPCLPRERCVFGCICRKGYVLDAEGNCILLEDCPKV